MSPLDDFRALVLGALPGPDEAAVRRLSERSPRGLGRLDEVATWLAAWTGRAPPQVTRPVLALYAGGRGGGGGGARARLEALAAGTAPVSGMARRLGAGLDAFDLAVDRPMGDSAIGPAMSERECAATLAFGMEALAKAPDLLLVGEVAGGSDPADLAAALGGEAAAGEALARVRTEGVADPLQLLRQLGGRETAALAGAILAARVQRTPVVLDGFGAGAAAAVLHALRPGVLDHCLAAHAEDVAHRALLERIGLRPLLELGIRAGEGAGATAALGLIQLACSAAPG